MPLFKNTASQKCVVFAYDKTAETEKTGDAANITAYISKDGGAAAQSTDNNPVELSATNMPGLYVFDLDQPETNCDLFSLSAASTTTGIYLEPVIIYTETA